MPFFGRKGDSLKYFLQTKILIILLLGNPANLFEPLTMIQLEYPHNPQPFGACLLVFCHAQHQVQMKFTCKSFGWFTNDLGWNKRYVLSKTPNLYTAQRITARMPPICSPIYLGPHAKFCLPSCLLSLEKKGPHKKNEQEKEKKFLLVPMGVPTTGSTHARPSAWPPSILCLQSHLKTGCRGEGVELRVKNWGCWSESEEWSEICS